MSERKKKRMKKKLLAAAVAVTAVLMLGGCEGLSAKNAKGPETEESCLYITKDGSIQWVSVEHYEGGSYSKEELLDFASEKIKEYNEAKGTENSKEPVTLVSGSLENGKAVLITSYDSGESLVDFAGETGDDTMPFAEVKTGTPEELSEELKAAGLDTVIEEAQEKEWYRQKERYWMQTEAVQSMTDILLKQVPEQV